MQNSLKYTVRKQDLLVKQKISCHSILKSKYFQGGVTLCNCTHREITLFI